MALNIFPRPKRQEPVVETEAPVVEAPVAETPPPGLTTDAPKRARRGSRGGRGRGKARAAAVETVEEGGAAVEAAVEAPAPPARRARAPRPAEPTEPAAPASTAEEGLEAGAAPRRSRRKPAAAAAPIEAIAGDGAAASILRAIEVQNRQIERLLQLQEDMTRRISTGGPVAAPPARVAVFVDAANIELAVDRLRTRLDWGKILRLLTEGRQLMRAVAYSPVHDDPTVSIETQRFVEPFLDHGFKVVTKPLKRFQDGTIKANVDIELALDVISMLDRLDVVCLVSGDGDFQRLVEMVQSRGVRVVVVGVGSSVAGNLKNAADEFIDLATRTRELRA